VTSGSDLVVTGGTVNPPIYRLFASKGVNNISAIKGQTLMMGGPKDVTLYIFDRMIAPVGLKRDDFDYVYAGGTPDRYRALQSGAVAGTLLFQPYDFVAQRDGYPLLLDSYQVIKDLVFSSFTVARPWLANEGNRARLVRWLAAVYKGSQAVCDPANKEEMIAILTEKTHLSEDDSRASYDLLLNDTHSIKCDLRVSPEELQKVIDYIVDMGDMSPPLPDTRHVVDMSYLDQAVARARGQ
jgi:ABC-type nitrate/sulfonate/bicarbonate transport system substrate-binding protein